MIELFRELAPQVLGALLRRNRDMAACEDALQEALIDASDRWSREGVPRNPRAWLIHVARKRLADRVRSEVSRRDREALVVSLIPDEVQFELIAQDDTLDLFFMCCHPALSSASATALTLRALGGLSTLEIARAFLVPEATMAQRLSRARQTLRDSGIPFEAPEPAERAERMGAVLRVLYLIFNEGYVASSGEQLARVDLSSEAIRLARLVQRLTPDEPEVNGLLALMLLTDARRGARCGEFGELIPLDEQDRSLWDRASIEEGTALIAAAFERGAVGPYQVQAAIAALHDEAPSTEATDWPQILALYGALLGMQPNPMVALNHTIAVAMVHGPRAGLAQLEQIASDARLKDHYRYEATRAHLLERVGERASAIDCFERAAERTASVPERDFLRLKAARLRQAQE